MAGSRIPAAASKTPAGASMRDMPNPQDAGFCTEAPDEALARRRSSRPIKAAGSPTPPSPGRCGRPASASRWTAAAGAWSVSSSSDCGARSRTRRSACTRSPTASRPGAFSARGPDSATPGGLTRRWVADASRGLSGRHACGHDGQNRGAPRPHRHRRNGSNRKIGSRGYRRPELQPEHALTRPPTCPAKRDHLTGTGRCSALLQTRLNNIDNSCTKTSQVRKSTAR